MKKCIKCNCEFNTNRVTCPLCKTNLITIDNSNFSIEHQSYPKYKEDEEKKSLVNKIFSFITTIVIIVCLSINILYFIITKTLWSLIVLSFIFVIWGFVRGLIIKRSYFAKRITNFILSVMLAILSIEYLDIFKVPFEISFGIKYLFPFLLIGAIITVIIADFINKDRYKDDIVWVIMLSIVCMCYPLLYTFNLVTKEESWVMLVSFYFGFFIIIAMFVFARKRTIAEIKKRFSA